MFGMLPFERSDDNLFDTFDNFTRNFFRGSNASLPAFRSSRRYCRAVLLDTPSRSMTASRVSQPCSSA